MIGEWCFLKFSIFFVIFSWFFYVVKFKVFKIKYLEIRYNNNYDEILMVDDF